MSNTYYQDELRYLREVGPEFARANPEIARFLADRGADPDVERMLEGVAFLCGRIRQKLDDELPELTANVMSLLWPHYLRPIPSLSILEFLPDIDTMQGPVVVEQGAEFASVPIDGTSCRYGASWPTKLRPWAIESVALLTEAAQPVRLKIRFRTTEKATLDALELDTIRLYLSGDPRTTYALYLLLAAHVQQVTVSGGEEAANRKEIELGTDHVQAAGLDRSDSVLPYPSYSFPGYRLLQEYFAFKDRFLFVDLKNLDASVVELGLENQLEVLITFDRLFESYPLVSRDNIRLHCVPIKNLFRHTADPIRIQHDRTQYLIQPGKTGVADRRHVEVYSVDEVLGLVIGQDIESRTYEPFYSMKHMASSSAKEATYYQTRVTPNVVGGDLRMGTDTYISFVSGVATTVLPKDETISIELTCTNRDLPVALRAADICEPTDTSPAGIRFRNLLKPTPTIAPPLGNALHWRLISHMSLNYVALTDVDHFRELLRVYDFQSAQDAQKGLAHQRMLDGILSIKSNFAERLIRGAPVRGVEVELELNEEHFAGEGDAYLFGGIIDRFLGLYVTVNAFSQLTVRMARSGQLYSFPARWGEQLTPAGSRMGA